MNLKPTRQIMAGTHSTALLLRRLCIAEEIPITNPMATQYYAGTVYIAESSLVLITSAAQVF